MVSEPESPKMPDVLGDEVFDPFTRLAAHALGGRGALLSLVDRDSQRFESQFGLDDLRATARAAPLLRSLCEQVVQHGEPMSVSDAREGPDRAVGRELANMELAAYIGFPILSDDAEPLGALVVIDDRPRTWTDSNLAVLGDLARLVAAELELHGVLGDARLPETTSGPEPLAGANRGDSQAGEPGASDPTGGTVEAIKTLHGVLVVLQTEHEEARAALHRHTVALAHEVRTPLNAIRGLAEGLVADVGSADRETAKDLRVIGDAAAQALEIVRQELALSARNTRRALVRIEEMEAASVLHAVKAIMAYSHRASPRVELVIEDPEGLPTMRSDRGKIAQILRNLVSNALSATEEGQVRVSATHDAARGLIAFTVSDTGRGIAPGDETRIFDEFAQVDPQTNDSRVGFGLPMSRRFARLLGGDLTLDQTAERGTSFTATVAVEFAIDAAPPDVEVLSG